MEAFTQHNPSVCLTYDDLEALNVNYPQVLDRPSPNRSRCPRPNPQPQLQPYPHFHSQPHPNANCSQ